MKGLTSTVKDIQTRVVAMDEDEGDLLTRNKKMWSEYLLSEALLLDDTAWYDFQEQTLEYVIRAKRQMRERIAREEQRKQQQQLQAQQHHHQVQQHQYNPTVYNYQAPIAAVPPPPPPSVVYLPSPSKEWSTYPPTHGLHQAVPVHGSLPPPSSSPSTTDVHATTAAVNASSSSPSFPNVSGFSALLDLPHIQNNSSASMPSTSFLGNPISSSSPVTSTANTH